MTQKVGRGFLLKISDGAAGFTAFAGINGKSLKINNERIDTTLPDADTPEGAIWRSSLDGVKSVSFSGDGKLVKDASEGRLATIAMGQDATDDFSLVVPNVGVFTGTFSVELEFGDDGAMTFSISAESTGEITFVAEPPAPPQL